MGGRGAEARRRPTAAGARRGAADAGGADAAAAGKWSGALRALGARTEQALLAGGEVPGAVYAELVVAAAHKVAADVAAAGEAAAANERAPDAAGAADDGMDALMEEVHRCGGPLAAWWAAWEARVGAVPSRLEAAADAREKAGARLAATGHALKKAQREAERLANRCASLQQRLDALDNLIRCPRLVGINANVHKSIAICAISCGSPCLHTCSVFFSSSRY